MNSNILLLTFDYELFLGKNSGNSNDCLIHPTNEILKVLNAYNVKGIFYLDTMYLYRCFHSNQKNLQEDYHSIMLQLSKLVSEGHYVFPHIHPHWLDAKYSSETHSWDLSNLLKYRFHSLPAETKQLCFEYSVNFISELYRSVNRKMPFLSYRAGGWSIQPFDDFKNFFLKYNIYFDMSVIPGIQMNSNAQVFDFTRCPDKYFYRFEHEVDKEEPSGTFSELTISRVKVNILKLLLSKVYYKIFPMHYMAKGNSVPLEIYSQFDKDADKFFLYRVETASLDTFNLFKISDYLRHLEVNAYLHLISHPKMFSKEIIKAFDIFLNKAVKKFNPISDFNLITSLINL